MSNFVVYKSSAGSGKTFTLVKEYLRLALYDPKRISYNYKRILAVTFTNKAAAEMKQRVIDALYQVGHQPQLPPIGQILCKELKTGEEELRDASRQLLNHILHNYSDFSIGTIDSFTHKIVKTFAHDLNLPVNFNLETDIDSFYGKVVAELLSKIGEDAYITKLLKEYALHQAENNSAWDPEKNIFEFVKLLKKEDSEYYTEQLARFSASDLDNFRKEFFEFARTYETYLKLKGSEALQLTSKYNLTTNDFWFKASGPVNLFHKSAKGEIDPTKDFGTRVTQAVKEDKWANEKDHPINQQLTKLAQELMAYVEKNGRYYELCRLLSRQLYRLMLIKKIEEISREKKNEEQIVFISEFNRKIFELINNEPTPFIYERLGERYHHYLLDEFQDTSGLQWQNILPLLDNSLASGRFNLIVGDGKQSIYRWRNANVKQFANLPNVENTANSFVVEERIDALKRNYKEEILATNYRSVKTIVEFNNNLFDALSSELLNDEFRSIYNNQAQKIMNDHTGYITFQTGKIERDDLDGYNCEHILKQIRSATENGFAYNDICIILRKNKFGPVIASYLVENNIPVVSSDSLLLRSNPEVNALVSFLDYLNNPDDTISAAAVINYLSESGRISNAQLAESLKKIAAHQNLFHALNGLGIKIYAEDLLLNNLFDNCVKIVSALELNTTNALYIRFFLDEVSEFLVTRNSNILQFTTWWKTRKKNASVIIPESTNAVKIMTIHTSKGLEFPVVILPFCNWEQFQGDNAWVQIQSEHTELPVAVVGMTERLKNAGLEKEFEKEKQEQVLDNLNLLYVAFTRAAERLHVITTRSASNKKHLVSEWIEDYLAKQFGERADGFYETGEPKKALEHKKSSVIPYSLSPLVFNAGNDIVKIKPAYLKNSEAAEDALQQGIVMHWVLSKIETLADVDQAVAAALTEGHIKPDEQEALKKKLIALLEHPKLQPYYTGKLKIKTEAELITESGEILRPDRVIFDGEAVIILDYKTGEENTRKYAAQMRSYEQALLQMQYRNITKIIAYIDRGEVVELA